MIPVGRALLYAEPIYLQAERSPMPQLRLVVLALQERLVYGPTFEVAMSRLFGSSSPPPLSSQPAETASSAIIPTSAAPSRAPRSGTEGLISEAARDLADYQRLTAEGKLGEAGQRLEALKDKLERLQKAR